MICKRFIKSLSVMLLFCMLVTAAAVYFIPANSVVVFAASSGQQLSVTAPVFSDVYEGYGQPEAKPVILRNTGDNYITGKVNMTVNSDNFVITQPDGNIVLAPNGETDSRDYNICPKAGLPAGEYTDVITVSFGSGQTASAEISFKVKPADEEWKEPDPGVPDKDAPQTLAELRMANPADVAKLSRFDSRNYGIVPPVKDQGSSNICWCYAAITASEISVHKSGIDAGANTDNLRLSPEILAQSRHSRGADPLGNTKGESTGQDWYYASGNVDYTAPLLSQWCGPVRAGASSSANTFENAAYHMENAVNVYSYGASSPAARDMMKRAIAEYGAITFSYNNMHEYEFYNPKNESGAGSSPHACTIIGWDDNIPAEKFRPGVTSQNGGWLVKNSYSSLPYFWLSYDCSAASNTWAFTYAPADKYDFNYFYDSVCDDMGILKISSAANVFEAKKGTDDAAEELRAVSVGITGNNTVCNVAVYTDLEDTSSPVSGTLAASGTAEFDYSGYYTIELDKSVVLERGSRFSIVASVSNADGSAKITIANMAADGSSYQSSGDSWSKSRFVPRIKAFTKLTEMQNIDKEPTPEIKIDYINEKLSGFTASEVYKIDGEVFTASQTEVSVSGEWFGKTLSVVKLGDGVSSLDSDAQRLYVPARPAAPNISVRNETASGKNDGQILGVNTNMEYMKSELEAAGGTDSSSSTDLSGSADFGSDRNENSSGAKWIGCTSDVISGLSPGNYRVRIKATEQSFAGEISDVTVAAGSSSGGNSGSTGGSGNSGSGSGGGNSGNGGNSGSSSVGSTGTGSSELPADINGQDADTIADVSDVFEDVNEASWYHDAVQFVYENGLMRGTYENYFSPNLNTNRAMIVTVLYRMSGIVAAINIDAAENESGISDDKTAVPESAFNVLGISNKFADVQSGGYYADAVKWAASEGIVTGYASGMFMPDKDITREEFAVILWRYAGSPAPKSASAEKYQDIVSAASWSREALSWAVETGVLTGRTETLLAPSDFATRAEAAAMFMRFAELAKSK